jgi:hypothetical protein
MSVAFKRGTTTGPSDLSITIRNNSNDLIDPYRIEYAVYDFTTGVEVLMGSPVNTPIHISTGMFYAQVVIPADSNMGTYRIRWTIQEYPSDPVYQTVQEYAVVDSNTQTSVTGDVNFDKLVYSLRTLLRDNNPDRNYRFSPPSSGKYIQGQTQVFGFIWEDEELIEYIYMALDDFNSRPPTNSIVVNDLWGNARRWRTTILLRASAFACFAIALNWVASEFSYSISGVSLDIDKSSKYQAMKDEFIAEYDKLVEQNKLSIKIIKGLRQYKYGVGIQSALGPLNRPGVQSRSNLLGPGMGGF